MTHNIHELDPDEILFAGDWHGYTLQAYAAIERAALHDIPVIIQLGDFGFYGGYQGYRYLEALNTRLAHYGQVLYFVDGNHEDFNELYSNPLAEDGTRPIRSNIYHLPRGFRFTWSGVRFLALGGAHSVDKKWREPGHDWFNEEHVTDQEVAAAVEGGETDIMLMHDVPAGAPNIVTDDPLSQVRAIQTFGNDMITQAEAHRAQLKRVSDAVDPTLILHGHYHGMWHKVYQPKPNLTTHVICLDEGGAGVEYNTMQATLADLQVMVAESRGLI